MPSYYLSAAKIPTRDAPAGRPSWAQAWVPAGCDPANVGPLDRRWIWLSRFTDHALVVLRDPVAHPDLTLLASSPDERIAGATRAALQDFLGDRSLNAQATFRDTVAGIFLAPPIDERWGTPLRPNRRLGLYRVDLQLVNDPLFWSQPGPLRTKATVTLSDDFNRTAGNLGGSTASGSGTWTELNGTALATDGTTAGIASGAGFNTAWITTNFDTDDHYAQVDITTLGATDESAAGVGVRIQGAAGNQGYGLEINDAGAARMYRWDTDANIDTGTVTIGLPDTMYLEFDGSAYECLFNGSLITGMSGTDTLFTGHLRAALSCYGSGVSSACRVDNFLASDISTGVSISPAVGALVLAGLAPGVQFGMAQPGVGALTLAGLAPTASVVTPSTNDAKIIIRGV